ncbi:helix-turn-helix transcriptional regulator [Pseudomonas sp. FBF18]|uniref:helix-turn-helix transcriptional regulator n=2 Tax=unclassified Pseudomonas TaxID=196821 RepID=UPI0034A01F92
MTRSGRSLKVLLIESIVVAGVEMIKENSSKPMFRILRMRQLRECLGLSTSTIYDRLNPMSPRYDCNFPKPIKLGASAVGWIEEDVCRWIDFRIAKSRNAGSVNSSGVDL